MSREVTNRAGGSRHDKAAWRDYFSAHHASILAVARGQLSSRRHIDQLEPEELVSEGFVSILTSQASWDDSEDFSEIIERVLRNVVLSRRNKTEKYTKFVRRYLAERRPESLLADDPVDRFQSHERHSVGTLAAAAIQRAAIESPDLEYLLRPPFLLPKRKRGYHIALQKKLNRIVSPLLTQLNPLQSKSGTSVSGKWTISDPRPSLQFESVPKRSGRVIEVWYGTNRKKTEVIQGEVSTWSYGPHPLEIGHFSCGKCRVFIPDGECWAQGSSERWNRLPIDSLEGIKLLTIREQPADAFRNSFGQGLDDFDPARKEALLFVHGYNVAFARAAKTAAFLSINLMRGAPTAFFSWPSFASVQGYMRDADCAHYSKDSLLGFIDLLLSTDDALSLHVVVHSMGNIALLRQASALAMAGRKRLGRVLLVAPDVDVQEFLGHSSLIAQASERATLYASSNDRALGLSSDLRLKEPRAGKLPPMVIADNLDSIDVSGSEVGFLGHSHHSDSERVQQDMHDLLVNNTPPERRGSLHRATDGDGRGYWRLIPSDS